MKGMITARYPDLHGRDWVRDLEPEDLAALLWCMNEHGGHGLYGGQMRAATALRLPNGRFAPGKADKHAKRMAEAKLVDRWQAEIDAGLDLLDQQRDETAQLQIDLANDPFVQARIEADEISQFLKYYGG